MSRRSRRDPLLTGLQGEGGSGRRQGRNRGADAGERFFGRRAHQGGMAERKAMIDREHDLPIARFRRPGRFRVA